MLFQQPFHLPLCLIIIPTPASRPIPGRAEVGFSSLPLQTHQEGECSQLPLGNCRCNPSPGLSAFQSPLHLPSQGSWLSPDLCRKPPGPGASASACAHLFPSPSLSHRALCFLPLHIPPHPHLLLLPPSPPGQLHSSPSQEDRREIPGQQCVCRRRSLSCHEL